MSKFEQNMNVNFYQSRIFLNAVNKLTVKLKEFPCNFVIYGTGGHTLELLKHLTLNKLSPLSIIYDPSLPFDKNNIPFPLMVENEIKHIKFDYIITSSLSFQFNMINKLRSFKIPMKKVLTLYDDEIYFNDLWRRLQEVSTFYFCYENCYDLFNLTKQIYGGNLVEIGSFIGRSTISISANAANNRYTVYSIDPWQHNYGKIKFFCENRIFDQWLNNIKKFGVEGNVRPLIGCSSEIIKKWDKKKLIDILFIDGAHNYKDSFAEISEEVIEKYKVTGLKINGKYYPSSDYKKLVKIYPSYDNKKIKLNLPIYGVKVDFDLWSPLIKKNGYIAFHDICEEKHPAVDRVWKEEIKNKPEKWSIISERNNLGIAKKL